MANRDISRSDITELRRRASTMLRNFASASKQGDEQVAKPKKDSVEASCDWPDLLNSKKVFRIYISLFYGSGLLLMALWDLRAVYQESEMEGTPSEWHSAIIYAHVVSFYVLLLGFIVAFDTEQVSAIRLAVVSLVINIVAFSLRIYYEVTFADFFPVPLFPANP